METELIKQFAKKMIKKGVMFIFFLIVFTAISQSISPTVTNYIALTQMENSDMSFSLLNAYNKIRPVFGIVYSGIIVWFAYGIGRDIYKFAKTVNAEEKPEN